MRTLMGGIYEVPPIFLFALRADLSVPAWRLLPVVLIKAQIAAPGGDRSRGWDGRRAIKVFHRFHQDNDGSKCEVAHTSPPIPRSNVQYSNFDLHGQGGSNATRGALDMINMITTALDVGIMTGIVLFVAFGLTLRRDGPHRSFE